MKKIFFVGLTILLIPDLFAQSNVNEEKSRKEKGYYNITQISMLMGLRSIAEQPYYYYSGATDGLQVSPSVTMTHGGRFNEHWAAGIGVGFEIFDHNLFPVFADLRYTLRDNSVSPFFAFKMGHSFGNSRKHYDNLYLAYEPFNVTDVYFKNYGGFMLHPEMGVKVPLSGNADLLFTVAYRLQKMKTKITQKHGQRYEWEHKASMNRLSFGVAIMFR